MITIGIKELKNKLSQYLREIKKGEKIVVTEREKVIATIVPVERVDEDPNCFHLLKMVLLYGKAVNLWEADTLLKLKERLFLG